MTPPSLDVRLPRPTTATSSLIRAALRIGEIA
jgi:hypothetical protein